ncbi:TrmH family RNA methyltransferase [Streptomyces sp. NPDC059740]|uniref:TrmH family RNA methyltransferase n=1 Tax=Streptomyces sp. NPDC059740 TaxID=3346926 RepID=UPI003649BFA5
MAEPIPVEDPDDPRLRDYASLTDVALRRVREPAEGLFIAEGEKVIRRALAAGYEMRSLMLSAKWLGVMRDVVDAAEAPVHLVTPALAEQVTGYHVHRGALAAMRRKTLPPAADLLAAAAQGPGPRRVAVLEDIVDHANVGAAFRNAAALGVAAVLLSPRCADPLYRRAVKVSMGAVLQTPWTRLDPWPEGLERLKTGGYTLAAFGLGEDSVTLDALVTRRHERLALLFGTEGDGLSPAALSAADVRVRIPMESGVDSLNVAAASAVAFYATR